VLTWGDYQDLLPEHPSLWCYRRQWQGQTLVVAANLSREFQRWQPARRLAMMMSNYAEATRPTDMTLRPFEAVWWLQDNAFPGWRNAHPGYGFTIFSGWTVARSAYAIDRPQTRRGACCADACFFFFSRSHARKNG
jgi:hypothetical protein